MVFIFSRFVVFYSGLGDEVFVSLAEPWSAVRGLVWLLFFPPTLLVIAGALLVTISPLYRAVDRVTAWLVLPWCAMLFELASMIVRASDACARTGVSTCGGADPVTSRVTQLSVLAVAGISVLLLLIRLGRARSMAAGDVTRWWTATAVALGLLTSALPVVLLPLTYRQGSYVSFGVDGVVAYPGTLGATLMPVLVVLPVWTLTVVLLVRSRVWTAWAKVIGVGLLPLLLAAVVMVTAAPSTLSPDVQTAGTVVAITGAAAVIATAAVLFLSGARGVTVRASAPRVTR